MRIRRTTVASLALALALASMAFKCGGTGPTGQPEPLRNAARAADAVAKSIGEMINVKRALHDQTKISDAEELKLTQALLKMNTADKVLVNRLKSMSGTSNASACGTALSLFNEVSSAFDDLNNNGVLGLSNADARTRLSTIISTIRASLQIIQTFTQTCPTATPTATPAATP